VKITRHSVATAKGTADWFTGSVFIDTISTPSETFPVGAAMVHFTPAARTAWHTHPHGQTIHVIEGVCLCQRKGGAIETVHPGQTVYFEPGEVHWHGAAPDRFMTHLAMQLADESGSSVTWLEHVNDEEYGQQPA
jgi:quercetin dioxygenase-like cupin family protein